MYVHGSGRGLNIRMIDSLNFLPMNLAKLPSTFGLEAMRKDYFPHLLNTTKNHNYIGPISKKGILHECSCFIEFIKRVGEKRKNARLAEHFISFRNEFNKFNNTRARMLDSIYHMTLRLL